MARRNSRMNGRSRIRLPTRMGCPDTGVARAQCHHVSGRRHPLYDDGEANLGGGRRTGERGVGETDRPLLDGEKIVGLVMGELSGQLVQKIERRRWHLGVGPPIVL